MTSPATATATATAMSSNAIPYGPPSSSEEIARFLSLIKDRQSAANTTLPFPWGTGTAAKGEPTCVKWKKEDWGSALRPLAKTPPQTPPQTAE